MSAACTTVSISKPHRSTGLSLLAFDLLAAIRPRRSDLPPRLVILTFRPSTVAVVGLASPLAMDGGAYRLPPATEVIVGWAVRRHAPLGSPLATRAQHVQQAVHSRAPAARASPKLGARHLPSRREPDLRPSDCLVSAELRPDRPRSSSVPIWQRLRTRVTALAAVPIRRTQNVSGRTSARTVEAQGVRKPVRSSLHAL